MATRSPWQPGGASSIAGGIEAAAPSPIGAGVTGRGGRSSQARRRSSSPSTTGATRGSATAARSSTRSSTRVARLGGARARVRAAQADQLYGLRLRRDPRGRPRSAFVAVGSPVSVFRSRRLDFAAPAGDDRPIRASAVTVQRDGYTISNDPARLDADAIHAYLTTSYWAERASRADGRTVARRTRWASGSTRPTEPRLASRG